MAITQEQQRVMPGEAASIAGRRVKPVRAPVNRGEVSTTAGPFGHALEHRPETPAWPEDFPTLTGRDANQVTAGVDQALEALRAELRQAREGYGRAMVQLGRLQAMAEKLTVLAERAESLIAREQAVSNSLSCAAINALSSAQKTPSVL